MKVIKRLFIAIVSIVLIALLTFNIYNFVSIEVLKKDITSIFGYSVLEVVSGSMEPTIHVGDLILINTNDTNYNADDIVTFYDINGDFVTHRILLVEDGEMITKGDNNNTEDESTNINKIVGKYVFRIPNAGKIMASFKTPFVMVMVLIIGVLMCFMLSTDKNGNPILTETEKEMQEFKEYQKIKNENKAINEKEIGVEKEINKEKISKKEETKIQNNNTQNVNKKKNYHKKKKKNRKNKKKKSR